MNKFLKNLFFAFAAQGSSMILSVLISVILPKILGVEQFAYWQLFIFYSGYVGLFHFGLSDGLYLKYGGTPIDKMDKSLIGSQFRLMVLWQFVIGAIVLAIIPFIIHDENRIYVWIMTALYLVIANATWCLGFIFQAANETKIYSTGIIISKAVFIVALIVSFIFKFYNFKLYVLLYVISQAVAALYSVIHGWSFVTSAFYPLKNTCNESFLNMKIGINLTISNIASTLILGFARGFVDLHWSIEAFGVFSLAISLVNFILQFINQVSMVMFPALRQTTGEKQTQIYVMLRDSMGILLCGVLIAYVPMRSLLTWWIPAYSESLRYLSIILPICVFDGKMAMLYNTYMKVLRKEKTLLAINLFSCCLSLALCAILTLLYDNIMVVVVAIIIVIAIRSLISSVFLSKCMHLGYEKNIVIEIGLCLLFIAINTVASAGVAFSVYGLIYIITVFIKRDELFGMIKTVVKKNRAL